MVLRDLEHEGVVTKFCKIWRDSGVPNSWVLHSGLSSNKQGCGKYAKINVSICFVAEDGTRMVVHHNPLPDITHEDFVSLLGPLLAPENYPTTGNTSGLTSSHLASSASLATPPVNPRPSMSGVRPPTSPIPNSPAPFDWLHFEGRTVKTTLSNMTGLDGLARERKWRSHCIFSVDIGRKGRQGVEAVRFHVLV